MSCTRAPANKWSTNGYTASITVLEGTGTVMVPTMVLARGTHYRRGRRMTIRTTTTTEMQPSRGGKTWNITVYSKCCFRSNACPNFEAEEDHLYHHHHHHQTTNGAERNRLQRGRARRLTSTKFVGKCFAILNFATNPKQVQRESLFKTARAPLPPTLHVLTRVKT